MAKQGGGFPLSSKPSSSPVSSFKRIPKTGSRITDGQIRNDSPPIQDLYGDYKSDSQLYFTDKLEESKRCSLWLVLVAVIVMWNPLILSLQLKPLNVEYLGNNIRCKIPDLENKNLSFDQIKTISHYSNATSQCYYYDLDYWKLSQKPFEEALNLSKKMNHSIIKKCEKYLLRLEDSRYNYLDEFDLLCYPHYFNLFHFVTIGDMIGFAAGGFISDIYGRRKAIILTVPISVVGCILKAVAPTYWSLYIFTCITEASLNISSFVGVVLCNLSLNNPTYVKVICDSVLEIVHCKIRIFMVTFLWLGVGTAGFLKMAFFLWFRDWNTKQFQWMVNCTLLVPICAEWLLPESPHWLLCHKDWRKMGDVLNEMNYPNLLQIEMYNHSRPLPPISAKEIMTTLLKPAFRNKLFLGGFLFSLTYFLYNAEGARIIRVMDSGTMFSLIEGISVVMPLLLLSIIITLYGFR